MDKPRFFLGLDGGGTKTHCVLYDAMTDTLNFISGGPTNHEVLPGGMEDLAGAIGELVFPLLQKAGIKTSDLAGAAFGMGGIDMPIQYEAIHGILEEMGFKNFGLSNDGYLGIHAECASGIGIGAVNGSGCSVVGIGAKGDTYQIGGHNDMTGDKGGGCYLVPATIRAAYTSLFKRGEPTILASLLEQWLGISDKADFCQAAGLRIIGDRTDANHSISQILYEAAGRGDPVALGILTECGEDYALSISCVAEALELQAPVDVVLIGSQFTKGENDQTIKTIERILNPAGGESAYRLKVISTAPVAGALLWAMEIAGCPADEQLRNGLKARLASNEGSAD